MELRPMEDVFLGDDVGPTIAEHASQCNDLFQRYMKIPGIAPDPTVMDDQLARFTLWAFNMDVFGPLNVSLDYRLRYSPTVVEIIHQLLDVICDSLKSLRPIDDPPQTPSRKKQRISERGDAEVTKRAHEDSNDGDTDEDQAQNNISLITYNIGGTVTRLYRLSNAIRKSAKAKRTDKIERYQSDEEANIAIAELRLYTECYIRFRFPHAPEVLRLALIEANALRLRRLYYQRSHRRRIALSVQRPQPNPKSVQLPKTEDNAPAVRFAPIVQPKPRTVDQRPTMNVAPSAPITYATTARQTDVGALYANSTAEVPRAKSVLVNNKLSFPPIPTTGECPYCGVIVEFRGAAKSMMWHDHVIKDLEPFLCIIAHCMDSNQQQPGSLTFETSKAWMSHMQNAHGYAWECRAPSHKPIVFEQEAQYQEHSCKEHGVPELHVGTLSSAARRPILDKILECPFGDDFRSPPEGGSNPLFSSEALHLHIATHMKEIALLALQKLPSDAHEDAKDVDSDQPLTDNGYGFANLRGSMYSVLDDEDLDFQDEVDDHKNNDLDDRNEDISPFVERLDLEDKDTAGMTKLHRAVQAHDLRSVRFLIDEGANLRTRANDGKTALHYASLQPSKGVEIIKLLLSYEVTGIINAQDDNGQTPLHYAAEEGSNDAIKLFADHNVDINIADNHGFSPYLWAVVSGRSDAAHLLLELGADVNSCSANGKSALSWAASLGYLSIVNLIMEHRSSIRNDRQLSEAAAIGDQRMVQSLLEVGAYPLFRDSDGWSAIHWAAEEGHTKIVNLLLQHGADVNAVSSYGSSPLHCAANGGHGPIVRKLLQHGADPLKITCHGWTPLHHAAYMGHSDVVDLLLKNETILADAFLPDNHGWSVLHLAVLSRELTTIRTLLSFPVISETLSQCDENGFTAEEWLDFHSDSHVYISTSDLAFRKSRCCRAVTRLRQAVVDGNISMVKVMLKQRDPVNGTDSGRRTALYYAAKMSSVPMMSLLLDSGADPNILPTGRLAWEEFISDDLVLLRLRQAGNKIRSPDPKIDQQIRRALSAQLTPLGRAAAIVREMPREVDSLFPEPRDQMATSPRIENPTRKAEGPHSRAAKIWKRLRGQ